VTRTPIQRALLLAVPAYRASLRLLATREERNALRDVLTTAIAKDWLRESGLLDDLRDDQERDAA
jgi:hypothetical protein